MRAEKKGWAALQLETHFTTVFCNTISSASKVYNTSGRGQWVSDSREIRHHCAYNWNPPPLREQTWICWQAAWPGVQPVASRHEIKQRRVSWPVRVTSPTRWIQAIDKSQICRIPLLFSKTFKDSPEFACYSTICNLAWYFFCLSFQGII